MSSFPPLRASVRFLLTFLVPLALLSSCASYKQNLMFRPIDEKGDFDPSQLTQEMKKSEAEYVIQPNDLLRIRVFTNKGEFILDPNGELNFGSPGGLGGLGGGNNAGNGAMGTGAGGAAAGGGGGGGGGTSGGAPEFLVLPNGQVRLPMVNWVKLAGLTIRQTDSLLERRYSEFYKDVFVVSKVTNRRVIVLGQPERGGQVVTLTNDHMNLLEVLALAGGIGREGKARNIRLIRGDLKNPQVQQIDLGTLEGMRKASLEVEANDVVYVEPLRRPFNEGLRDILPIVTILATLSLLIFRIGTLN